jgi:hypothetical protein
MRGRFTRQDKSTIELNKFYKEQTTGLYDSLSSVAKFNKMHSTIVNTFSYNNELEVYSGQSRELQKVGINLENKILRSRSRWRIYSELAERMNDDYYITNLHDIESRK